MAEKCESTLTLTLVLTVATAPSGRKLLESLAVAPPTLGVGRLRAPKRLSRVLALVLVSAHDPECGR